MNFLNHISSQTQYYHLPQPFWLESGKILEGVQIAYRTWGKLNQSGDNAVLICHALTGGADADDWWKPLFGAGQAFDLETDFVVCSNVLGSCYGTTGAASINPLTKKPYGAEFPRITIRDMVHLQAQLMEALGIKRLQLVIGGSLGGMQVLEWAVLYPEMVNAIAPIAVSGKHSAWCIGISETQRQAIFADPDWQNGNYYNHQPPARGLATARMMAMMTYRAWGSFEARFGREQINQEVDDEFTIASYLQYQGQKLVNRFDANCYVSLTYAMDSHDLGRDRGEFFDVLANIQQPTLVVAINTDILYPPQEQEVLARYIPNAEIVTLNSTHGHDAFLIDMDDLNQMVVNFRTRLQQLVYRH